MKVILKFCLVLLTVSEFLSVKAQEPILPVSKYGLPIVNDAAIYKKLVRANPDNELLDLRELIPSAHFDVTYADTTNEFHRPLYESADVFMRKPAAIALKHAQEMLQKQGLGLLFFDGYRPYAVTVLFWERTRDTTYVADPRRGSKHNRGMAIDCSLFDLKTGEPLSMPSRYDLNSPTSYHSYMGGDSAALAHRALLRTTMEKAGFRKYEYEWWHYDFPGAEKCYNYDLTQSQVRKANVEFHRNRLQ